MGEIRDHVREAIEKTRTVDPAYHSVVTICEERALLMAEQLERKAEGLSQEEVRRRYPLAGRVFAVKDNLRRGRADHGGLAHFGELSITIFRDGSRAPGAGRRDLCREDEYG